MLALPFALRDLLVPEIAVLCRELGKPTTSDLVNPSTDMVQVLNRFLDWFVMVRQMMIPVADVPELQRRALTMKEELQRVFPEKSGKKSAEPWNFLMPHTPDHTGSEVLANCTTAYTETQVFEKGHKPNVKKLTNLTNQKNQYVCISHRHERSACLSKLSGLSQAISRHAKVLARGKSEEDVSSSSSSSSDSVESGNYFAFDQRESRPREVAVKLPLWDLSFEGPTQRSSGSGKSWKVAPAISL